MAMASLSGTHPGTGRPPTGLIERIRSRWQEYRLVQTVESVPFEVMKDVGFPAAERQNDR